MNCSKDLQKFFREKEKNSWISTVYEFYVLLFLYIKILIKHFNINILKIIKKFCNIIFILKIYF